MRLVPDDARHQLQRQRPLQVRVRPDGFEIDGETTNQLQGRVYDATIARKLFADRRLLCQSSDGVRAADGTTECATCSHRAQACQAILRIRIALTDGRHCTLDLANSSANNLVRLDDELAETDVPLPARNLRMTVVPHDHWGEVRFTVADPAP